MDIYQIIITYNKAWTKEETVCFGIILIFLSGILAISVYKHKILKQQAVAISSCLCGHGKKFYLEMMRENC